MSGLTRNLVPLTEAELNNALNKAAEQIAATFCAPIRCKTNVSEIKDHLVTVINQAISIEVILRNKKH